ncbi:hypothetical protein [Cupriavidus cauae]|nr:hypothetical protein [Cupriavidus cauae]
MMAPVRARGAAARLSRTLDRLAGLRLDLRVLKRPTLPFNPYRLLSR